MTSFLLLLPLSGRLQRARVRRYRRREPLDEPLGVLPADEHLYRVTQRARWRDAIVDNPELLASHLRIEVRELEGGGQK